MRVVFSLLVRKLAMACLMAMPGFAAADDVTVLVGNQDGVPGAGTGELSHPSGASLSGNTLLIADSNNERIVKYDLNGGGTTSTSTFGKKPADVLTYSGKIVYADPITNKVYYNGDAIQCRGADNQLADCEFLDPSSLAVDSEKRLYISSHGEVFRYSFPDHTLESIIGEENTCVNPPDSGLCENGGIAVSAADVLYIADMGNDRVLSIDVSQSAPQGGYRAETVISGIAARSVSLDATGNIFVTDVNATYGDRVLMYPPGFSGGSTVAGGGSQDLYKLDKPSDVVLGENGDLYVVDTGYNRVVRWPAPGTLMAARVPEPFTVQVLDNNPNKVLVVGGSAVYSCDGATQLCTQPITGARYSTAAMNWQGDTYVCQEDGIYKYAGGVEPGTRLINYFCQDIVRAGDSFYFTGQRNGEAPNIQNYLFQWDGTAKAPTKLPTPEGIYWQIGVGAASLYLADFTNNRIMQRSSTGQWQELELPPAVELCSPSGVVVSLSTDVLYIADQWNNRLLGIDLSETPSPSAATTIVSANGKGAATSQLRGPNRLALYGGFRSGQAPDYLYVSDQANNRVVRYPIGNRSFEQVAASPTCDAP